MDRNATLRWILERDEVFRYQLLSRMKMDCEFFSWFWKPYGKIPLGGQCGLSDRVYEVNMG